jgi:hypothetical protein
MKETIIGEELEIPTGYEYHGDKPFDIDKLIVYLNDCKKDGATNIRIHGYCEDEDSVFQINIIPLKIEL